MTTHSTSLYSTWFWRAVGLIMATCLGIAQQSTTKIKVELNDNCHPDKTITIVLDQDGKESIQMQKPASETTREWTFELPGKARTAIHGSKASALLGGSRTDCRCSIPIEDPANTDRTMALFTLTCDNEPVRSVTVHTVPQIDISYVRRLPSTRRSPKSLACDCEELLHFLGDETIPDIRYPRETLTLLLGWPEPSRAAPGLRILDRHGKDPAAPSPYILDPAVRILAKPCLGNSLCLKKVEIFLAFAVQSLDGNGAGGRLPLNDLELVMRPIHDAAPKGVTLRFKIP
jgi:hypothetical protein